MGNHWTKNFKKSSKLNRTFNGRVYHSKKECERAKNLYALQQAGEIIELKEQVPYELRSGDVVVRTPTGRVMKYVPDFVYFEKQNGEWVEIIEDVKGYTSKEAALKIAVFEALSRRKVSIYK